MKRPNISQIKEYVRKWVQAYSVQKDIPNKINRLNDYANSHKKQTVTLTMGILLLCSILSILLSFVRCGNEADFSVNQIEDITPIIANKQKIEEVKQRQVMDVKDLLAQGKSLKRELDSLIVLPVKSHHDSLEIYRKHKQLEIIVNYIDEKD